MSDIKAFLFDDDRGVSPVIGVILMVAITVILAAVIAAFVLGLGDTNESAPNVNWDYDLDESNDELTITHANGDTIDNATIDFQGPTAGGSGFPDTYTAGDSATINLDSTSASAGDDIDIVFVSEDGGSSNIIGTFTLPPDFSSP